MRESEREIGPISCFASFVRLKIGRGPAKRISVTSGPPWLLRQTIFDCLFCDRWKRNRAGGPLHIALPKCSKQTDYDDFGPDGVSKRATNHPNRITAGKVSCSLTCFSCQVRSFWSGQQRFQSNTNDRHVGCSNGPTDRPTAMGTNETNRYGITVQRASPKCRKLSCDSFLCNDWRFEKWKAD